MKKEKLRFITVLLVVFLVVFIPVPVSADDVNVGSGVTRIVNADLSSSSNGSSDNYSSSSGEISHEEAQNAANIDRYNSKISNILENSFSDDNLKIKNISPNNGSQYVNAQIGNISLSTIEKLGNGYNEWYPDAYWYGNQSNYNYNYAPYSSSSPSYTKAKKYVKNSLVNEVGMDISNNATDWSNYYDSINRTPNLPSAFYWKGISNVSNRNSVKNILNLFNDRVKSLSANNGVSRNINGLNVYDFANNKNRQQAVAEYVKAYKEAKEKWGNVAVDETVKVVLIKELNIEDTKHSVLYSSQSTNWPGFGKPIQVEYKYITDVNNSKGEIGIAAQTQYANNGDKITMYPMKPGKYEWTQTQIYNVTYSDVMSYSYNQYLIIADTGQVIWSKTSNGPTDLDYSSNGTNIDEIENPYNTPYVTFYNADNNVRNVYDIKSEMEYISFTIVDIATESDINNGGISRSAFADNFLTFRIN